MGICLFGFLGWVENVVVVVQICGFLGVGVLFCRWKSETPSFCEKSPFE